MDQNNLTLVEQSFRSNAHDLNRDKKKNSQERSEKDINIKTIIKKKRRQMDRKSKKTFAIWI